MSHAIAYLYHYADASWKTQLHVHEILKTRFHEGPGGLAANDDAGQMSAWYVLSAMGILSCAIGDADVCVGFTSLFKGDHT